ncbi:unnamed protein product [Cyclocybe aegerita]|uniref:F-box domain-containing protein n=1 Tax=Cyclocybe aegerita TaxID=1973307 RepID=A0A8S0VUQ4_CYCAE|nr:unnamed protein product [Cyclocybe aegerita]
MKHFSSQKASPHSVPSALPSGHSISTKTKKDENEIPHLNSTQIADEFESESWIGTPTSSRPPTYISDAQSFNDNAYTDDTYTIYGGPSTSSLVHLRPPSVLGFDSSQEPIIYSFTPTSPVGNSLTLMPPEGASDALPRFHIVVTPNIFNPFQQITSVYRGETQFGDWVASFEMGISSFPGRVRIHRRDRVINNALRKDGPRNQAKWTWTSPNKGVEPFIWDFQMPTKPCVGLELIRKLSNATDTSNPPNSRVSMREITFVHDLAPELLSIIFSFLHDDQTALADIVDASLSKEGVVNEEGALERNTLARERRALYRRWISPTFFPYSCAAVCQRWKAILSGHPQFWTRIIVFVDTLQSSPEEFANYLTWSGGLPIDVCITRRPQYLYLDVHSGNQDHVDGRERASIRTFAKMLQPHLPRCRSLHIDVASSSSLPFLGLDFRGSAQRMTSLTFQCDQDDAVLDEERSVRAGEMMDEGEFCPSLCFLALDGRNFLWNCDWGAKWCRHQNRLHDLTVSGFTKTATSQLTVDSLLRDIERLPNLKYLKLNLLELTTSPNTTTHSLQLNSLEELSLSELEADVIIDIFRTTDMPELERIHMQGCALPQEDVFVNINSLIQMLTITEPELGTDIIGFVDKWDGSALCVAHSYLFNDRLLRGLGTRREKYEDEDENNVNGGVFFPGPNMQLLLFKYAPFESFDSLKQMIEERGHYVDYSDPDWRENTNFGPALHTVMINKCGFGPLEPEDEQWLRDRLVELTWNVNMDGN